MRYKKILKHFVFCSLIVTSLFVTGCQSDKLFYQTENNVADVVDRAKAARHISNATVKGEPSLVVDQGLYVDRTPISLTREPSWLKNRIVIRGDDLPFSYYSRVIGNGGGHLLTRYQIGLDPSVKVSINYTGTVRGALDLLAARTGYIYSVRGNNIYWQAFITRTFDVAFMPGSTDYQLGKGGTGSSSGGGGGGMGAGQTVNAMVDDSSASQFSNLKGSLSVWRDLENTIKELLSADGKVIVSEATTSVTVRDRPSNVELVSKFINNFNKNLSKQVLIKVQVLDVILSAAYNFGIDWLAVKHTLDSNFVLNANYGTPISINNLAPFATTTPFGGSGPGIPQIGVQKEPGSSTGVTALINALTQQGKVSIVTEPRVVSLNNQVSVIRIVNQRGYLASVQNTTVAGASTGGSGGTVTSQITPGTVITGLTLYILPKIQGEKIYLQVNVDLSNLVALENLSSGTQTSANNAQIQAPQVAQKQFNQRSVIASGDTLIISGFKQVSNTANAMQLFASQALGGRAATQDNRETIVLITPIVLHGYA